MVTVAALRGLPAGAVIVDQVGHRYTINDNGGCYYPLLDLVYDGEELVPTDGPFTLLSLP